MRLGYQRRRLLVFPSFDFLRTPMDFEPFALLGCVSDWLSRCLLRSLTVQLRQSARVDTETFFHFRLGRRRTHLPWKCSF